MAPNNEILQPAGAEPAVTNPADNAEQTQVNGQVSQGITFNDVFADKTNGNKEGVEQQLKKMIWREPVTEEDRTRAKEDLADEISGMISPEDQKNLKDAQAAIIDGKPEALAAAMKAYADDPAKLAEFVKELDKSLTRDGAGVNLALNKDGNVVLFGHGDKALEISPRDGSVTVRAIEHLKGGVLIKPGEVVDVDAGKVAVGIGDDATRGITGPHFIYKKGGGGIGHPGFPGSHGEIKPTDLEKLGAAAGNAARSAAAVGGEVLQPAGGR